jgi:hypothetical protein
MAWTSMALLLRETAVYRRRWLGSHCLGRAARAFFLIV